MHTVGRLERNRRMSDTDHAISYKLLERGTPVFTSDDVALGAVRDVLDNPREHIFDGLIIDTKDGPRFVDAPEVARITKARVTLAIDAGAATHLPHRDHAGGPTYTANARAGRLARVFGSGWRRE
jgi:hypothetical protein